jgi:hypothetical protein
MPAKKPPEPPTRKSVIDGVVMQIPNVIAKKIGGLDAYFVNDRMFACINGAGVGVRVPAAVATELQFSRDNISPFQPAGMPKSREWVQIDREDAAEYEKDLPLFRQAFDFVRGNR